MPLATITIPGSGGNVSAQDPADLMNEQPLINFDVDYELDVFSIERKTGELSIQEEDNYWLAGINALVLIFTFMLIFLYKNRPLQVQLVRFCFLMVLIFIVLAFFYGRELQTIANNYNVIEYKVADLFPLFQLLFLYLAARGITKDEELVRSADRIR